MSGTRARAPKVSAASGRAFMAALFEPLPDAELDDRELAKLERRSAGAERSRRRHAWWKQMLHVRRASARLSAIRMDRLIREEEDPVATREIMRRRLEDAPSAIHEIVRLRLEEDALIAAFHAEVRKQIAVPVTTRAEMKWKQETHVFKSEHEPWMDEAIEADERYLARRPAARRRAATAVKKVSDKTFPSLGDENGI